MKTLKTFSAAAVLSLALAIPTFAGDIQTPTIINPPPPPPAASVLGDIGSPGLAGDMGNPGVTAPGDIHTLGLVDIFLALFSLL